MYFVYIIQSKTDSSFYIGYTSNLEKRLEGHNRGQNRSTRNKTPWVVVYYESYKTKSEAIKRERFLKRQKSREFYLELINSWSGSSVG